RWSADLLQLPAQAFEFGLRLLAGLVFLAPGCFGLLTRRPCLGQFRLRDLPALQWGQQPLPSLRIEEPHPLPVAFEMESQDFARQSAIYWLDWDVRAVLEPVA